ncbi:efflux RND transporter permease subunit [Roseiterribacter gracilis]|uniref:Multidrug transporter n=1 Tax=Roseiterribacter gracilis TaxID=2812848 RepID=A0A8S8X837_9PROT|nr:multidrug transporter [Rhodospirillales bacterium TMPK1]
MLLTDISVRRPVTAMVLNALIIVFGLIGYQKLSVREYPRADAAAIAINTSYPGAAPEVIDTVVTRVIEDELAGVEGIDFISAASRDGYSSVFITFLPGRDLEAAANDVREGMSRATAQLPATVDRPVMYKFDSSADPVFILTLTSTSMTPIELSDWARRGFLDQLNAVPGVANVMIWGERQQSMRIWLDRAAMTARRITSTDVEDALNRENIDIVAGRIEASQRELTIRADTRLATPEAFRRLVVRQSPTGAIRLGDVARVEIGPREPRGALRINGKSAVSLAILKQTSANTLDVSAGVRKRIAELSRSMPDGTTVEAGQDDATPIRASIHEIFVALGAALALVALVVFAFLRSATAAAITMFAVPVSLAASFGVLSLLGYSINVFTLLAMVLAIGLVVDDAIIVVENIVTRMHAGEPPLLAAYRGGRQIGFAVIATTAVLMSVILPLTLVTGTVGPMLREFAAALVSSLFFSAVAALTFGPVLCANLLKAQKLHAHVVDNTKGGFERLKRGYLRLLDFALARPKTMLAGAVGAYALFGALYLTLPQELAPSEDTRQFFISVNGPEGASQQFMLDELAKAEQILLPYTGPDGEVKRVLVRLFGDGSNGGAGVNRGNIAVLLYDWDEKKTRPLEVIMEEMRVKLLDVPGLRFAVINPQNLAGAPGNIVSFQLGGNTYDELVVWRDQLFERLAQSKLLNGPRASYDETKPQLRVRIDRERAQDLGLDAGTISRTLEVMMAGRRVGRFIDRGREYDVMLQAAPSVRAQQAELQNFYVRSSNPAVPSDLRADDLIPLAAVVQAEERAGPSQLPRFDRRAAIGIDVNLAPGVTMSEGIAELRRAAADSLPPEARITFVGSAKQYAATGQSTLIAFGLAIIVAFLVLAAQFESIRLPLLVMATVPLALLGGVAALHLTGMTINTYTQIGMVMLIGLIAKNAILIVEFSNQLRTQGRSTIEAVREAAAARLRPILMTSIAAIGGAIPLAIAHGAGAEARSAIGVTIIGGVALGTAMSLFVTPVLYGLMARTVRPVGAVGRELAQMEASNAIPVGAD